MNICRLGVGAGRCVGKLQFLRDSWQWQRGPWVSAGSQVTHSCVLSFAEYDLKNVNEKKCFILLPIIKVLFIFVNLTKSNATMYEQYHIVNKHMRRALCILVGLTS